MMKSNVRMGGKLRWKGFQDRHDMFVGIAIGSIMTFFFMIIAYSGLGPKGGKFPEGEYCKETNFYPFGWVGY